MSVDDKWQWFTNGVNLPKGQAWSGDYDLAQGLGDVVCSMIHSSHIKQHILSACMVTRKQLCNYTNYSSTATGYILCQSDLKYIVLAIRGYLRLLAFCTTEMIVLVGKIKQQQQNHIVVLPHISTFTLVLSMATNCPLKEKSKVPHWFFFYYTNLSYTVHKHHTCIVHGCCTFCVWGYVQQFRCKPK